MTAALLGVLLLSPALAAEPPRPGAGPPRRKLAGLVIHSDDYALRRKDGVVEEWTGKAHTHEHDRDVWADWAQRRHDGDRWALRGRVRAVWRLKDKTTLEARGHEAAHDGEREAGTLRPLPGRRLEFSRKRPEHDEPDQGSADQLGWDLGAHRVTLEGQVRTWGPSGSSWSDRADFDTERRRLELSGGRPVLVSGAEPRVGAAEPRVGAAEPRVGAAEDWDGAVQADQVTAADNPRVVTADGKVRGWVVFRDGPAALKGLR